MNQLVIGAATGLLIGIVIQAIFRRPQPISESDLENALIRGVLERSGDYPWTGVGAHGSKPIWVSWTEEGIVIAHGDERVQTISLDGPHPAPGREILSFERPTEAPASPLAAPQSRFEPVRPVPGSSILWTAYRDHGVWL